jgi:hypothetical protein
VTSCRGSAGSGKSGHTRSGLGQSIQGTDYLNRNQGTPVLSGSGLVRPWRFKAWKTNHNEACLGNPWPGAPCLSRSCRDNPTHGMETKSHESGHGLAVLSLSGPVYAGRGRPRRADARQVTVFKQIKFEARPTLPWQSCPGRVMPSLGETRQGFNQFQARPVRPGHSLSGNGRPVLGKSRHGSKSKGLQ